jgi:hypothetical protein
VIDQNSTAGGSGIIPIAADEAIAWAEQHLDSETVTLADRLLSANCRYRSGPLFALFFCWYRRLYPAGMVFPDHPLWWSGIFYAIWKRVPGSGRAGWRKGKYTLGQHF